MSETGSRDPSATGMTPIIAESQLKKGVMLTSGQEQDVYQMRRAESIVVRIPSRQETVAFRLNTKRMSERREIERANEAARRAGN